MDKLIELVQIIKGLNELIDSVAHVCSNRDENFVFTALKQEKTRIFKEAQEIAKPLLFPEEIVETEEKSNEVKKSKKGKVVE